MCVFTTTGIFSKHFIIHHSVRSISNSRQRNAPLSPHSPHLKSGQSRGKVSVTGTLDTGHRSKRRPGYIETSGRSNRPPSPSGPRRSEEKRLLTSKNHRIDDKVRHLYSHHIPKVRTSFSCSYNASERLSVQSILAY